MKIKRYTLDEYKQALQSGLPEGPEVALAKGLASEVKFVEGEEGEAEPSRVREFIASTGAVDREGDTIDPMGWDVSDYLKSGTFLWAHDYSLPPIAEPVATWVEDKALRMRVKFAGQDMPHPLGMGFGHTIMRMYDEGLMKGVSVGFQSIEWKWSEDEERGAMAVDFIRQKLLEVSAVPVPANPEALLTARDKGINVGHIVNWAEEARDKGVSLWVPKHALQDILDKSPRNVAVDVPKDTQDIQDMECPGGNTEEQSSQSQKENVSTIAPLGAETKADDTDELYRKTVLDAIAAERKLIGSILRQVKLITKAGKVLSAANEAKLVEASNLIDTVLQSAKPIDDDDSDKGCGDCGDCPCGGGKPKPKPPKKDVDKGDYIRQEDLKDLVEGSLEKTLSKLTGRMPF